MTTDQTVPERAEIDPIDGNVLVREACAVAGYEVRRKKTLSPRWEDRSDADRRRYREIANAAIDEYERLLGYFAARLATQTASPRAVLIDREDMRSRIHNTLNNEIPFLMVPRALMTSNEYITKITNALVAALAAESDGSG